MPRARRIIELADDVSGRRQAAGASDRIAQARRTIELADDTGTGCGLRTGARIGPTREPVATIRPGCDTGTGIGLGAQYASAISSRQRHRPLPGCHLTPADPRHETPRGCNTEPDAPCL